MISFLIKIIRFGITGGLGFCVDFGITYLCKEKLGWNKYVANTTGFSFAVLNNYFLNRAWTFQSHDPRMGRQFALFLAISVLGLLINTVILYFFHEKKGRHFYLSKLFAVLIVFIWNFSANSLFTFHDIR